ncbi:MAG: hypothetical protein MUC50_00045 [Myxococcota bacterium]|jgi:DNA polymerase III epsilon subunit-like protein|nr:hypothetical protein [Myxococcota bacterium]
MTDPLSSRNVLIVDCQTTGGSVRHCQVIEIAWRLGPGEGQEPLSRSLLCALLDRAGLPRRVQALTGLVRENFEGALSVRQVMDLLEDDLCRQAHPPRWILAHTAAFEARFLDPLLEPASARGPLPTWLCTGQLSQWLLPGLPSYTLRAVAGYLGFPLQQLRRAGAHVEATLAVWRALCERLEAEGVRDPDALEIMLAQARQQARREPGRRLLLPRDIRRRLPDAPGVYRFVDGHGALLYVGKASRLRARVGSYVGSPKGKAGHTREMLAQAADVDFTVTESVMEAALLEARTIQELCPPYNRILRQGTRDVVYASLDLAELSPERTTSCSLGPFASTRSILACRAVLQMAKNQELQGEHLEALFGPLAPLSVETVQTMGVALRELGLTEKGEAARLIALGWMREGRDQQLHDEAPKDPVSEEDREIAEVVALLRRCLSEAAQLYRGWRRASTYHMLRRCTAVFQPVARSWDQPRRALVLQAGLVVEAVDLAGRQDPPPPPSSALSPSIDRAEFDRLGVLAAELRRQALAGHPAWLLLPEDQRLDSRSLERWLEASEIES